MLINFLFVFRTLATCAAVAFQASMQRRKRFRTLQEVVEEVTAEDDVRSIIIIPPDNQGDVTDEEDANENKKPDDFPHDVAGEVEVDYDENTFQEETDGSGAPTTSSYPPIKKQKLEKASWNENDDYFQPIDVEGLETSAHDFRDTYADFSPINIFKTFLNDEIMNLLVLETNRYASQHNRHDVIVTEDDIFKFIGILILSGYHSMPQQWMYWSSDEDIGLPLVKDTMAKNKFKAIKQYLHLANNDTLDNSDKLAKIRPFYDLLNRQLQQHGIFSEALSIDEQMVPYFGRHSSKMYMKGKPVKFGYKLWLLCSSEGYPFNCIVYTGKGEKSDPRPLAERVVMALIEPIENPKSHTLTFDNFFTSYQLLRNLQCVGMKALGTVRENRLNRCPIPTKKEMAKRSRGEMEYMSDGNVVTVIWNDNTSVIVASNYAKVNPTVEKRRYSQKEKKHIRVKCPLMVDLYNQKMGGVDLCDRFCADYRPNIKGKKWWFVFFTHGINLLVVAAWRFHKHLDGVMTHLEFRRSIVRCLLKMKTSKREMQRSHPLKEIQFDGDGHRSEKCKEGRCKRCQKNTCYRCGKCNVRLHQKCFFPFHAE